MKYLRWLERFATNEGGNDKVAVIKVVVAKSMETNKVVR